MQSMLSTLISGRKSSEFDPRSLGGPDLDDISYFNRYIRSLRLYEQRKNKTGTYEKTDYEPKVMWYLNHEFEEEDIEAFELEVLRRLNHYRRNSYMKN